MREILCPAEIMKTRLRLSKFLVSFVRLAYCNQNLKEYSKSRCMGNIGGNPTVNYREAQGGGCWPMPHTSQGGCFGQAER